MLAAAVVAFIYLEHPALAVLAAVVMVVIQARGMDSLLQQILVVAVAVEQTLHLVDQVAVAMAVLES